MSFRSRLLLFFTIIVVIPMVAVALVLFSLTADSETGKADAEIAQGMRAAFAIYDQDRDRARGALDAVAGDSALGRALAHPRRTAAIRRELRALLRVHPSVEAIAAYDLGKRPLAAVGTPNAAAPAVATPTTRGGKRLGYVAVSVTPARDYVHQVQRTTALDVRLVEGHRILSSTLPEHGVVKTESGD